MSGPFLAWLMALLTSPGALAGLAASIMALVHVFVARDWGSLPTAIGALVAALAVGKANQAAAKAESAHAMATAAAGPNVAAAVRASKSPRKGPGR